MLKNESGKEKNNTEDKKTKKKFIKIIKDYKKEIIVGTLIIGVTIGTAYMLNKGSMEKLSYSKIVKSKNTLIKGERISLIEQVIPQDLKFGAEEVKLVSVQSHSRKLPIGYKPSAEKIATAAANGFELVGNQTWVDSYTKLAS
jgi:hypothetical protein